MSLALAAFAPHAPILLPTIGKDNRRSLSGTIAAYHELAKDLAERRVETVIIISPVGLKQDAAIFNLEPLFHCQFEEFGDLTGHFIAPGDPLLVNELKQAINEKTPTQVTSVNPLDYGSAVPLFFFRQFSPKLKVAPLYPPAREPSTLFALGQALRDAAERSGKNLAVVATGCLSQRLNRLSPAGYSPRARSWDKRAIKAVLDQKKDELWRLEPESNEVKELALDTLSVLLGSVDGLQGQIKQLSYEYPFGAGLWVAECLL